MPQSLPDTTPPKRRFRWPTGMPQLAALLLVLLVDSLVAPHFWQVVLQDTQLQPTVVCYVLHHCVLCTTSCSLVLCGAKDENQKERLHCRLPYNILHTTLHYNTTPACSQQHGNIGPI